MQAHVKLISLYLVEIDGDRALSRFSVVDIACSMRSQIRMTILVSWDLELSAPAHSLLVALVRRGRCWWSYTPRTILQHPVQIAASHRVEERAEAQWSSPMAGVTFRTTQNHGLLNRRRHYMSPPFLGS